jgi:glycosyltransferase involved in cell wall biosynthesis
MKKISVCIATYNGEKYIYDQLESILIQLNVNDEIIISDDFSSDNTIFEVKRFADTRIKIIYNFGDKGYTSNFENALKNVSGDIIFLSDQDDIWLPNKVEFCTKILENNDFVVTDCLLIDENSHIIAQSYYENRHHFTSLIGNLFKFGYLGCCFAFRKEVLQKALLFPPKHNYCTHDNWLMLVALSYFRYCISDEKMILYRRHEYNASDGGFKSKRTFIFKLKYRIYILNQLIFRLFK